MNIIIMTMSNNYTKSHEIKNHYLYPIYISA